MNAGSKSFLVDRNPVPNVPQLPLRTPGKLVKNSGHPDLSRVPDLRSPLRRPRHAVKMSRKERRRGTLLITARHAQRSAARPVSLSLACDGGHWTVKGQGYK